MPTDELQTLGINAMLITEQYRKMNANLHNSNSDYGTSSSRWASIIVDLSNRYETRDILDYGCGKGLLQKSLKWPVREYDPAIPGKDLPPEPADLVACTDVLEHIEPECLEHVLDDVQRVTRKIVFLTIATRPAKKVLSDGRNAHLIQQPLPFWLPLLWHRFTLVKVVNGQGEFSVLAAAKEWDPWQTKDNSKSSVLKVRNRKVRGLIRMQIERLWGKWNRAKC